MGYETLDLIFNFAVTVILNLSPALIIRYAIRKKRFDEKKHAIITCVIIAIAVYSVVWFISFSSIGLGIVPKGTPEFVFAVINFAILRPKAPSDTTESVTTEKSASTPTMDVTMKESADIMMPEKKILKEKTIKKLGKPNIILITIILVLSVSIAVLGSELYQTNLARHNEKAEMVELLKLITRQPANYVLDGNNELKGYIRINPKIEKKIKEVMGNN